MKPPQIPEALEADYEFWICKKFWRREEAVALLAGVEPRALDRFYRTVNKTPCSLPMEYINWLDVLSRDNLFLYQNHHNPKAVLKWAVKRNLSIPPNMLDAANSIPALQPIVDLYTAANQAPQEVEKKQRPDQAAKMKCQAIAKTLWNIYPDMTITDMKKNRAILEYGDGKHYRGKNTLSDWLREVDPRPKQEKSHRPKAKNLPSS